MNSLVPRETNLSVEVVRILTRYGVGNAAIIVEEEITFIDGKPGTLLRCQVHRDGVQISQIHVFRVDGDTLTTVVLTDEATRAARREAAYRAAMVSLSCSVAG